MRGLIDPKGETFAYLSGTLLYTMNGEPTGRLEKGYIVDIAGNPTWRVIGDAVYSLDGSQTIGYFGEGVPPDY